MKKAMILLLTLLMILTLAACGSSVSPKASDPPAASPSPAIAIQPGETIPAASPDPQPDDSAAPAPTEDEPEKSLVPEPVDVDLTQLSSTMVYSEVYAMATEPEQYIGKTVKMKGLFATQEYNGVRLYACIVQDATACCAQGLEFELAEELVYPDDYPEPGAEITVVGTFDSYKEEVDGNYYIYLVLRNARFAKRASSCLLQKAGDRHSACRPRQGRGKRN
jgi:hypothetical protein